MNVYICDKCAEPAFYIDYTPVAGAPLNLKGVQLLDGTNPEPGKLPVAVVTKCLGL